MSLLCVTVVPSSYQVRDKHLFYGSRHVLGIGAASFASHAGTGTGFGNGDWERGGDVASKDRAESPTASPERPKKIHNSQCIMHNF